MMSKKITNTTWCIIDPSIPAALKGIHPPEQMKQETKLKTGGFLAVSMIEVSTMRQ